MSKIYDVILKRQNGRSLTFETNEDIDIRDIEKAEFNGKYWAQVSFYDKETITDLQRKHFYALVGDCTDFTGLPTWYFEDYFKWLYREVADLEGLPSLRQNGGLTRSQGVELITLVIEYCILQGIPFRRQKFYLTADQSKYLYAMTMNRLCVVCGAPNAQIHHADNLVGMGRDRKKHDHTKSGLMSLCATHHQEAHKIGLDHFNKKYHLQPVRLSKRDVNKLGI